jgi:hypothetical protein
VELLQLVLLALQVNITMQLEKLLVKLALVFQMPINPLVCNKMYTVNVPVDCVPMVEVTLEQKKTVVKVQMHLNGRH